MAGAFANPKTARPLAEWLAQGQVWPAGDALVLVRELTVQVQALHQSGRTHRAISGETVLLASPGQTQLGPEPPVRSFGGEDSDPEFCPPELAGGEPVEIPAEIEAATAVLRRYGKEFAPRRIDVYQLGVLLCRLVTGEPAVAYLYSPTVMAQVPSIARPLLARTLGADDPNPFADCEQLLAALDEAIQHVESSETPTSLDETPARGSVVWLGGDTPPDGNPPAPVPKAAQPLPFERLGHYRIVARIGGGGMGDVYRGYDESLDREVAIKVLPAELARDKDYVRRFHTEATAAAKVAHPNIVPVYFSGEDGGHHFFAMQFVQGESLSDRVRRCGRLPVDETLQIVAECLAGLEAAHAHGLIHRDVKPGNVLLDRQTGRAVLVDFGLARRMDSGERMTATGTVMGTVDYIAPEQARGQEVDGRADIYSLGVLTYQLLSGRLPFKADTPAAMVFQHAYERPYPLEEAARDLPQPVLDIVVCMMAKNPEDRYCNCAAVLGDIHAYQEGRPVASGRSSGKPGTRPTMVLSAPEPLAEVELPAGLEELALNTPWQRMCDWAATMFRRHAPGLVQNLQSTSLQVDGAVAEYERRCKRLARLREEARSVAAELGQQRQENVEALAAAAQMVRSAGSEEEVQAALAKKHECEENVEVLRRQHDDQQRQLEEIEHQLSNAEAKLARLRSQRDVLNARLGAAQARQTIEGVRHRTWRSRFILPVAIAGGLLGLSVVWLLLFSTRRTEVTTTLEPKPGPAGPGGMASEMAEGTERSSRTPKEIAPSEEPSRLTPGAPARADQIRARRDQTLKGLSEKSLDSLIQDLIASGMPPMGPGMMPMDPRMAPRDPRMMPPSRGAQIPDRFVLVGKLGAVRAVDKKTWVYLWSETPATVPGMQPRMPLPPPVIGIEMDSEEVAQWMADYRLDDMVRVVAKSEQWVAYAPPAVRVFKAPSGRPVCYWFFRGEGLEKALEQGTTWIDPQLGRAQMQENLEASKRSPGFLLRNQSSLAGTTVRLTAQLHCVARGGNGLRVHLSVPDSEEGPIPVVVGMGGGAQLKHFLGYKRGATVEAEITLQKFVVEDVNYPKRSNGQPTPVETAAKSPGSVPPMYTNTTLDPLTGGAALTATGRKLQLQGDPSTLITPDGPSRPMDSIGGPVTPDVAHADSDAVGKEVVWSGTLSQVKVQDGRTHILVATSGESVFGLKSFEVSAPDPGFVDELADYREAGGYREPGDAVSVTGVVRAADSAKVRLQSGVPLVEIRQIQREGDPRSRAIVGQKRDPATLRADAAADRLSVVLRKKVTPGTVLKFVAEFTGYQTSNHAVLVNPKVSRYSQTEILFPTSDRSMFTDYRTSDPVEVTAVVGEQPDQPGAVLKLTGKAIVRKANPRSLVTDQGRAIPALDFKEEKRRLENARLFGSRDGGASEYVLGCGVFNGFTKGEPYYTIKIERLWLDTVYSLQLLCGADAEARLFLEQLQSGEEVLFEFFVVKKVDQTTHHLRWMSRIGEPDKKVTFPTAKVK